MKANKLVGFFLRGLSDSSLYVTQCVAISKMKQLYHFWYDTAKKNLAIIDCIARHFVLKWVCLSFNREVSHHPARLSLLHFTNRSQLEKCSYLSGRLQVITDILGMLLWLMKLSLFKTRYLYLFQSI